jgi:hypothetical protein
VLEGLARRRSARSASTPDGIIGVVLRRWMTTKVIKSTAATTPNVRVTPSVQPSWSARFVA